MHPYVQGNLGVMHSVQCKKFDMHNYVFCIEQFGDGLTLILCMLDFQAKSLQNLKCFQIDLTFKRVQGDINKFEVNSYDVMHKLTNAYQCWECILGDLDPGQAKRLGLVLEKRDPSRNWEEHLTYIFKSCLVHFNRGRRLNLEIEECKMKLAERRTADRKAQAEIEKLELENLKLRKELNM
ncbi:uncharacterized protein OCT59_008029 [Rhizophagus irregularis]|uniref:uncharacterized protein n=1 Tax=Rhizophagus irregularis TaxID=588596 RepID=UPI0033254B25|nr:hypothetical protein OCT59_008029 [Rhizophagus irregularis]